MTVHMAEAEPRPTCRSSIRRWRNFVSRCRHFDLEQFSRKSPDCEIISAPILGEIVRGRIFIEEPKAVRENALVIADTIASSSARWTTLLQCTTTREAVQESASAARDLHDGLLNRSPASCCSSRRSQPHRQATGGRAQHDHRHRGRIGRSTRVAVYVDNSVRAGASKWRSTFSRGG
jgi:hypothetical protein